MPLFNIGFLGIAIRRFVEKVKERKDDFQNESEEKILKIVYFDTTLQLW